jgi:hypothetical protein
MPNHLRVMQFRADTFTSGDMAREGLAPYRLIACYRRWEEQ